MFGVSNKLVSLFCAFLLWAGCAACSDNHASGTDIADIDNAREALMRGDLAAASSLCDRQLADSASLSAENLIWLSVLYMKIADRSDNSESSDNMDAAIRAYRMAVTRDSAMTKNTISSLDAESYSYMMMLGNITHSFDTDTNMKTEERDVDIDSLP